MIQCYSADFLTLLHECTMLDLLNEYGAAFSGNTSEEYK